MYSNLAGRVNNTTLPHTRGLLPLYEAIVNSIHAIEEKGVIDDNDKITVHIIREESILDKAETPRRGKMPNADILDFIIDDTGVGFNDANFDAFNELDTSHKAEKGGRGIGRLMWLKAFEKVEIESTFEKDGKKYTRNIEFDIENGVQQKPPVLQQSNANVGASIRLKHFKKSYQEKTPRTIETIARNILEHCMWYFLRSGGAPDIYVLDGEDKFKLQDICEENAKKGMKIVSFQIEGIPFEINHLKLRNDLNGANGIAYCANNRVVNNEKFSGALSWVNSRFEDEEGLFCYQCYIASEFLDQCVRADRTDFELDGDLPLFQGISLSWEQIKAGVAEQINEFLKTEKEKAKIKGRERMETYIEKKSPRYRIVLNSIDEELIPPNCSDKDLDLICHAKYSELEEELLRDGHSLTSVIENSDYDDIKSNFDDFLARLDNFKSSELAEYVYYRRLVLDLLEKIIKKQPDGKYVREKLIHQLVFPMQITSDGVKFQNTNLWLLDERLVFHHFLGSDKQLSAVPITSSNSPLRPDIISMAINSSPSFAAPDLNDIPILVGQESRHQVPASITVVEFKRPMRDDADEDDNPLKQVLNYFTEIRANKAHTVDGRPIQHCDAPGYAYVIADLTASVRKACDFYSMQKTPDNLGYYWYHSKLNLYIEVISLDKLYSAAYERNEAFFSKLGLPSTSLLSSSE